MQSFALLAVALVVAVHHSELVAHRGSGPHHHGRCCR
eukprot:COSAG06_NODE_38201_length_426_cov_0.715596_1_plen_36_part_01